MKLLSLTQMAEVHGAGNLYVTQSISADGINASCITKLVQVFQPDFMNAHTDEQLFVELLSACTFAELELLQDRIDVVTPFQVEFK